ncbi:MAG: DNA polymerase/3'-5' exonuclease PolX [Planctomycetes bacterium]|nr:DNA polymerase/3'-5' exonuclease PolX [Planctomycetota bacterium]
MDKHQVAEVLDEVGTLLELRGENPFKCRAYHAAARLLDGLAGELQPMLESGELARLKGIGEALTLKITELVKTGRLAYYEELRAQFPPGLFDMLGIPGLGPKRVKVIYEKLGIATIGELEYACRENRLVTLDGFGARSQQKVLEGIERIRRNRGRFLFSFAEAESIELHRLIRAHPDVLRSAVAGSVRRRKETTKDIDIVVSAERASGIMEAFTKLPLVETVTGHGETKSSAVLRSGIAADLRVVRDAEFPYALHHLTGSKEHNVAMRARAQRLGLKMNEYGLFRGEELVPCKDEEGLFAALGLDFIPPELREDLGEITGAEARKLPRLVERKDLRGVLHVHSRWSDGIGEIEELARAARKLGYEYLGLTDHSQSAGYANGLSVDRVQAQWREIEAVNARLLTEGLGMVILKGIESDILRDGSLDYPDEVLEGFDLIVGSVHSLFGMPEAEMTARIVKALANPYLTILGHPTGRLLLGRDGYSVDLLRVIDAAAEHGKAIELNANPQRLDLDWRFVRQARERGAKIAIDPDAHTPDGLADVDFGVGTARKGWLEAGDVVNSLNKAEFLAWIAARKTKR